MSRRERLNAVKEADFTGAVGTPIFVPKEIRAISKKLPKAEWAWISLTVGPFANYIAARYNAPVYLVGSVLQKPTPRDIDIRVVVRDAEFTGRYGVTVEEWHSGKVPQSWVDDMAKRNGELASGHRMNGDFQVIPEHEAKRHEGQPRILLASPSRVPSGRDKP